MTKSEPSKFSFWSLCRILNIWYNTNEGSLGGYSKWYKYGNFLCPLISVIYGDDERARVLSLSIRY